MSLTFNGSSSKLEVANKLLTASFPSTMFCWIKPANLSNNVFALGIGNSGGGSAEELAIYVDPAGSQKARAWMANLGAQQTATGTSNVVTTWQPVMAVFTSATSCTIYYAGGAKVTGTVPSTPANISLINRFVVGTRPYQDGFWFNGDIAEVAVWSSALGDTEWASLAAGATPESVSSGSLVESWSLQTQASTQTGTKGKVLTATSTSQGATHPITRSAGGPTINTQPSNATVTTPATATFTVAATASGGTLTYQWQRSTDSGSTWSNVSTGTGGTTSSYTTPATSVSGGNANNNDRYRCNVTDSNGTTASSGATLTVNAAATGPTINTQPSNSTVTTPATATFTVSATTSGGTLTYQWQRSTDSGSTWSNVSGGSGGTTASYTTPATSVTGGSANTGDRYRCAVTDSNGTTNSNSATLTVSGGAGTFTSGTLTRNNGTAVGATTLTWLKMVNRSTGADYVVKTSVAVNSSSVFTTTDASLTSGTTVTAFWRESGGAYGWGEAVIS